MLAEYAVFRSTTPISSAIETKRLRNSSSSTASRIMVSIGHWLQLEPFSAAPRVRKGGVRFEASHRLSSLLGRLAGFRGVVTFAVDRGHFRTHWPQIHRQLPAMVDRMM